MSARYSVYAALQQGRADAGGGARAVSLLAKLGSRPESELTWPAKTCPLAAGAGEGIFSFARCAVAA